MAWERRGSGRYYYSKKRIGGRVVSQYVGAGPLAELCQQMDEATRAALELERRAAQQQLADERAQHRAADQRLADLDQGIRALVTLVLIENGYHQHKGEWRRRRGNQSRNS